MHTAINANRRWVALAAALLFVFQALIASSSMASPGPAPGKTATTIVCTASGPRVVSLDISGATQDASQHSGSLPHCCVAGCAMLSGATLPELFVLAWLLPEAAPVLPRPSVAVHFSSALARLPQKSRAPPPFA